MSAPKVSPPAQVSFKVTTRLKSSGVLSPPPSLSASMQKYPSLSNWKVSPGLAEARLGSTKALLRMVRECGLRSLKKLPSSCALPGLGATNSLRRGEEKRYEVNRRKY